MLLKRKQNHTHKNVFRFFSLNSGHNYLHIYNFSKQNKYLNLIAASTSNRYLKKRKMLTSLTRLSRKYAGYEKEKEMRPIVFSWGVPRVGVISLWFTKMLTRIVDYS